MGCSAKSQVLRLHIWILLGCISISCITYAQKSRKNKSANQSVKESSASNSGKFNALFFDAVLKYQQQKLPESAQLFREALKVNPKSAVSCYHLAKIYQEQQNLTEALGYAKKAIDLDPKQYWYHQTAAEIYGALFKYSEGAKLLEKSVQLFPDQLNIRFLLAEFYLRLEKYDLALDQFDAIEKQVGFFEELFAQRIAIYQIANQTQKIEAEYQKLIKTFPYEARYYMMFYQFLQETGKESEAIQLLEDQLLPMKPNDLFAILELTKYYQKKDNTAKVQYYVQKIISNNQVEVEHKVEFVGSLLPYYQKDKSIKEQVDKISAQIFADNAAHPYALALRGDLCALNNQPDSARYYYRKALEQEEFNVHLWEQLLNQDLEDSQWEALKTDSEGALERFPTLQIFLYYNGIANFRLHNYAPAIAALEKVLKIGSPDPAFLVQVLSILGDTYHYAQQYAKSDEIFEKILRLDPDNTFALNNYAYYLSVRKERLPKALEMIERVIRLSPDNASYQDTYGWVLFQMEKYGEARRWIEKAYRASQSGEVTEHLGDVLYKLGNKQEALDMWKEAKNKGQQSPELDKKIQTGIL